MQIVSHRKIYFIISGTLIIVSALTLGFWGLDLAIDFTGGTLIELEFKGERPANQEIRDRLAKLDLLECSR